MSERDREASLKPGRGRRDGLFGVSGKTEGCEQHGRVWLDKRDMAMTVLFFGPKFWRSTQRQGWR
jgi:hypothetical protein